MNKVTKKRERNLFFLALFLFPLQKFMFWYFQIIQILNENESIFQQKSSEKKIRRNKMENNQK